MIVIKVFVALLWTVIAFLLCLPIDLRMMFVYIYGISYNTLKGEDINPHYYIGQLTATWNIFFIGYYNIFNNPLPVNSSQYNDHKPKIKLHYEVLWAVLFWGSFIIPWFYL